MTDNKRKLLPAPQGGMFQGLTKQIKLIARLMGDSRVNPLLKALPLASVAYWLMPLPLDAAVPVIDDAAILWIGSTLFLELCPQDVVMEHKEALGLIAGEEIVDADSSDVND
jgi:hypothetical protein